MTMNLRVENLEASHYEECIAQLTAALAQFRAMERGEAQAHCATCGDNDHTADGCWYHNPLLLSVMGRDAILGEFWRCFHCGAVYTSEEGARGHFGTVDAEVAKCLQALVLLKSKPTVPEVLPLVHAYYAKDGNSVGGNLHIVLEDGNVGDSSVEFCLAAAQEAGDEDGVTLAQILLRMSPTQRWKLRSSEHR